MIGVPVQFQNVNFHVGSNKKMRVYPILKRKYINFQIGMLSSCSTSNRVVQFMYQHLIFFMYRNLNKTCRESVINAAHMQKIISFAFS